MDLYNSVIAWTPHWSISLLLGLVLGPYVRLALAPLERLVAGWGRQDPLVGEWYEYHWSRVHGKQVFRKDRWVIQKTTFEHLTVLIKDSSSEKTIYEGKLYREGNHWIKETKGKDHVESTFSRLTNPIPPLDEMFIGIFISTDFDGKILGGVQLLCRRELTEAEAVAALTKSAHVDPNSAAIRVDTSWIDPGDRPAGSTSERPANAK